MSTLSHSESSRLYSWWWDSHISPKNSKWLQENLTDMDAKVKSMIKLIEEDADSFARRAEMYYKKRPELIKLVEEFYRAYRALAERYDYATGELRQAHRTIAKAFPDQAPFVFGDESSSVSADGTEPHMPETPHPVRSFFDLDDLDKDAPQLSASDQHPLSNRSYFGDSDAIISKKGLKSPGGTEKCVNHDLTEKEEVLHNELSKLLNENQKLNAKVHSEFERASKAESEVQYMKKALTEMQAVKEAVQSQYQQNVEKLACLKGELISAEKDSMRLNEQASKAEAEFLSLKEAMTKLEAEKDVVSIKNKDCLERISNLEVMASRAQEVEKELEEKTLKAEMETQFLNKEILRLELEKEAGLHQYKKCLEKISDLEKKLFVAEADARHRKQQADGAETEVAKLKVILVEVTAQKEATALQHKVCLEKISNLENEISCAQDEIRFLKIEILSGATKLKTAEDKCDLLEMSNQTIRLEADNMVKKIALKDKELSEKHGELEKLQICLQEERSRYDHVEATLYSLQNMHSQSQEDQRTLTLELQKGLQMLKDLEISKHDLEEEIRQIKDENYILKEQSSSSTISMKDLQNEIIGLTRIKEGFEEQVRMQLGKIDALQNETFCLKEEIFNLNKSYQSLVKQVEIVGLDPQIVDSSVKELQDENSRLRQMSEKDKEDKEILFKKLVNMVELLEKNVALQSALSDVTSDLEGSLEKAKVLQESCNILHGEKSVLVSEKAALISQIKLLTENMQELFEKNSVLESSMCTANSEVESLRKKSKSLEELSQLLGNEKASLATERSVLAAQLEIVERRLHNLEKRFTEFEGNYAGPDKEKKSSQSPLEELMFSFGVEKHERESLKQWSESRLASLERQITLLQEESKQSKKEFQEELDKSVSSQFEIHILQKFVQDMEEKNYSLLTECQKQIEASKLAEDLISELENENLEQQVEEELLLAKIEKLRSGVHQVLKALEIDANSGLEKLSEDGHICVHHILEGIAVMKNSLLEYEDDMQQLAVESSVLLTLLKELSLEGREVESEKNNLNKAYKTMSEQFSIVQSEREKLLDMNRKLRSEVSMGNHHVNVLIAEVQSLTMKQAGIQSAYLELEEKYSQTFEESKSLSKMFSDLKKTNSKVDEENDAVIHDMLTFGNLSTIFSSLRTDAGGLKLLLEDLNKLNDVNSELVDEVNNLREELGMHEIEKLFMKDIVEKLEMELSAIIDLNSILKQEIASTNDSLNQGEEELFDAEMKIVVTENLNSEICRAMQELKKEHDKSESIREYLETQILKLSEDNVNQNKNLKHILEVKGNLESEMAMLWAEIEERRIREENLNSELQERHNEFDLWNDEAEAFYFNLQLSAIREFLFEDKVHELSGVCKNLQDENSLRTHEIELLKERISFPVGEVGGLTSELLANSPTVMSLKENIELLDAWAKLVVASNQTPKDMDLDFQGHGESCQQSVDNQDSSRRPEILELQKLQNRIKVTEKVVVEEMNRLAMLDNGNFKSKSTSVEGKAKQMEGGRIQDEPSNNIKLQRPEVPEIKNGVLMKDILLDQVSDSSLYGKSRRGNSLPAGQICLYQESAENNHRVDQNLIELQKQRNEPTKNIVHNDIECVEQQTENPSLELDIEKELGVDKLQVSRSTYAPNRGGKKKKILERLASDGQKLANIQANVQDLRRKLEMNKKSRSTKNVDLETVKEQLIEAEETVVQLINLNGQMTRKIEDIPVSKEAQRSAELDKAASFQRKKVSEQARKESEKIGRLQLEIQKIQYLLLQAEEGKKSKGKNRFSMTKSRTTIILRDFIHSGSRSSARQKKGRLCGCFKPSSTNTGGNVTM